MQSALVGLTSGAGKLQRIPDAVSWEQAAEQVGEHSSHTFNELPACDIECH